MKDDSLYLIHMNECVRRIDSFTSGGRDEFHASVLIQDAVLRNLQTLGESSKRLSTNLKRKHPTIPWEKIAGFRNILVHDYLGVDLDEVWNIVENHLPTLRVWIQGILDERELPATEPKKRGAVKGARRPKRSKDKS